MEKFLFFENATTDITCIPAYRLVDMVVDGSGDAIRMNHRMYKSDEVGSNMEYTTLLTVNSGKAKKVLNSISEAISVGKNPFIIIADDVNKVYIDSDITAVSGLDNLS
tara:strand:+ start:1738 stop:2061 length:324 start_codon:yes stop_codon:yes gene_type:complete